jgi:hypothetical protein
MTWAWQAPLPPGPKIVLLALADIADDEGICWPGHRSLAAKCSITVRTVQRTIAGLQAHGQLLIEPRYRQDGSRSSNRYRLPIETPHDKLTWGDDAGVVGPPTRTSWPPDVGVGARTTTEPSFDPAQPLQAPASGDVVVDNSTLIFPSGITESQRTALRHQLDVLPHDAAQQILDELAGRMQCSTVKNPVGYAGTLIRLARNGSFVPELSLAVADLRHRREEDLRLRAEQEAAALRVLRETPVTLPGPLRDALDRMQRRIREQSSNSDSGASK